MRRAEGDCVVIAQVAAMRRRRRTELAGLGIQKVRARGPQFVRVV
jgi:hypothetical protein